MTYANLSLFLIASYEPPVFLCDVFILTVPFSLTPRPLHGCLCHDYSQAESHFISLWNQLYMH